MPSSSWWVVEAGNTSTNRVIKKALMLAGWQNTQTDFIASNPGPTLLMCFRQLQTACSFIAPIG